MSEKDDAQKELKKLPIKIGDTFKHYKAKGTYQIVTLAVKEDTLKPLVVYRSLGHGDTVWVRTYKNFIEEIDVNGNKQKRFTLLT